MDAACRKLKHLITSEQSERHHGRSPYHQAQLTSQAKRHHIITSAASILNRHKKRGNQNENKNFINIFDYIFTIQHGLFGFVARRGLYDVRRQNKIQGNLYGRRH